MVDNPLHTVDNPLHTVYNPPYTVYNPPYIVDNSLHTVDDFYFYKTVSLKHFLGKYYPTIIPRNSYLTENSYRIYSHV
jgi:hypothetical protein